MAKIFEKIKRIEKLQYEQAKLQYENIILSLTEINPEGKILDLGCNDGVWTLKIAKKVKTSAVYGIEILDEQIKEAANQGINVKKADLNSKLPFPDNFFNFIHANQVIEHLYNTDCFIGEIKRVLKPNGYCIVCTENLSSWHNIFALFLGWQPFSLTNVSTSKFSIGNPLSPHYQEPTQHPPQWQQHTRIFAYRGLKEVFENQGLKVEKILGAGYYPLPGWLAKIDPKHSAFLIIKVRKNK
jgi:ubiquinone/menaquinone biosynthesis C-methylase UbiE